MAEEFKKTGLMDGMGESDEIERWITVKGNHIPIKKGQSQEEAIKQAFGEAGKMPEMKKSGHMDGLGEHSEKTSDDTAESGYKSVDTKTFVNTLAEAKATVAKDRPQDAWRVSSPNSAVFDEEHPNAKKYTTPGGSTVAITPDGDIVAVCKSTNDSLHGKQLIQFAVKNGGNKLDAFSGLWKFYTQNGFEPVSWTHFVDKEDVRPDDWKPEYGKEPVVFYKYTGKATNESLEDFKNRVPESKDYFAAQKIRDDQINGKVKGVHAMTKEKEEQIKRLAKEKGLSFASAKRMLEEMEADDFDYEQYMAEIAY